MDIYHVWCNLKSGVGDLDFTRKTDSYLGHMRDQGLIHGFRITRRKLGLGPSHLGEFHIMIEVEGLAQLDKAFEQVSGRAEPIEGLHHAVNSLASDLVFALYRDFPDPNRVSGQERF